MLTTFPPCAAPAGRSPGFWRPSPGDRFLKWAPAGSPLDLLAEAERLRWVQCYTPVPEVLDTGTADDGSTWMLITAVPGTTAVAERWLADPGPAGDRRRAAGVSRRGPSGIVPVRLVDDDAAGTGPSACRGGRHRPLGLAARPPWVSVDEALAAVAEPPPVDRLVVCHGDACAPNTLIGDDGRWTGHVDLGAMGTADRWADVAIATWATEWNYGPGWEDELLDAYGIDPDPERTRYYRLLSDLGD